MCGIHCLLHLIIVSPVRTNRNSPFYMVELQHSIELVPVMPEFPLSVSLHTIVLRVEKGVTGEAEEN
jgi:hypothetical protein